MDNEADSKRQSAKDFFFQDQYKCQWNKSWEVGFKAEDFYEK